MGVDCPDCGRTLRKRAPNFMRNVKRREVGDTRDRFVCLNCRESYGENEVVESDDVHIQMQKWLSDPDE